MWPLSIWRNIVENREQKRRLRDKLSWMQIEEMKLSLEWNAMLVSLDHSIVFTSKTEVGLSQEYKKLQSLSDGKGRLGSVYSIKCTGRSFINGTHHLFISYCQMSLMTGVSHYEYDEVIRKYDEISKQIDLAQEQLGKKSRFSLIN